MASSRPGKRAARYPEALGNAPVRPVNARPGDTGFPQPREVVADVGLRRIIVERLAGLLALREKLDLSAVTIPIYELATREDHIAPAKSVFTGAKFFGGPVRCVLAGPGHIAGVVNPPDKPKYQIWTGPAPGGRWTES